MMIRIAAFIIGFLITALVWEGIARRSTPAEPCQGETTLVLTLSGWRCLTGYDPNERLPDVPN